MIEEKKNKNENFWAGFSFGAFLATIIAYIIGTKNGRKSLHTLLDFSEDIEGNLAKLLKSLDSREKWFGKEIKKLLKKV